VTSIVVVSLAALVSECEANGITAKRAAGILSEEIAAPSAARNPRYAGGVSHYVKVKTPGGIHIATYHEIVMPDGTVAHSHPKDYTRRDCSRIRADSEPDPLESPRR
jgi:hypothetical protein